LTVHNPQTQYPPRPSSKLLDRQHQNSCLEAANAKL
jgi:hypothetical protein